MPSQPSILVTGGAGFIGAHTCIELLARGKNVIVLDDLSNSKRAAIARIETIAGRKLEFFEGNVRDGMLLDRIFRAHDISAVMHFAAFKAVGESVTQPLAYFRNNMEGLLSLLDAMQKNGVRQIVFSSSCTVYGDPKNVPVTEDTPTSVCNPYGRTKLFGEEALRDLARADPSWRFAILRYFNPTGAHGSGLLGEDPRGTPNSLVPYIAQVAVGRLKKLLIFGGDYPTPDGTGVRDYIHVMDVARGHLVALDWLSQGEANVTVNLGTGRGCSVLEVLHAFESIIGRKIPYEIVARRPGDAAVCFADPSAAKKLLGWHAEHSLDRMCEDFWRWQSLNPNGL